MNNKSASEHAEIKILYFASLSEQLGAQQETFRFTSKNSSVEDLKSALMTRGNKWQSLFSQSFVKCAVNQSIVDDDHLIQDGDEIAFFPPVTGG